ncbi:MAG: paraquat-inducible protein A [Pseudomonadota bacterium]
MQPFIACHECDLLQKIRPLPAGSVAICPRCGAVIRRHKKNGVERALAYTIAGIVLFSVANAFPLMSFKFQGQLRETTLITGIVELYRGGMVAVAVLVMLTTILVPLLHLLGMLYVLLPLRFDRLPRHLAPVFRIVRGSQSWSMMEVFMLGILVSLVKLAKMAEIVPGLALFALFALIVVIAAGTSSLDPHRIWERMDAHP